MKRKELVREKMRNLIRIEDRKQGLASGKPYFLRVFNILSLENA